MTRDRAQAAVEEAFLEGVKRMFGVMVSNLTASTSGDADAMEKFRTGLQTHVRALRDASEVVSEQFPSE